MHNLYFFILIDAKYAEKTTLKVGKNDKNRHYSAKYAQFSLICVKKSLSLQ